MKIQQREKVTEMKKRVISLLLSLMLVSGIVGCGNNSDTNAGAGQEAEQETNAGVEQGSNTEVEQESNTEQGGKKDIETDNFVFLAEAGEQEYPLEEFEEWDETYIEFTTQSETNIYDMEGRKIGYIKPNVDIIFSDCSDYKMLRFRNPESGTDYEYLCVLRNDIIAQGGIPYWPIETDTIMILREGSPDAGEIVEISPDIVWESCNIEHTTTGDTYVYSDTGLKVGFLKKNVTITLTEKDADEKWGRWYRFENPESQIDSEYLLVDKKTIEYQQGAEEREEQNRKYEEAIALFDENKTYTYDDFCALMQDAATIMGVEFSDDVANHYSYEKAYLLDLSSKELKDKYEELVNYMFFGLTGYDKMDMYFKLGANADTSGEFEITVLLRPHKEEQ